MQTENSSSRSKDRQVGYRGGDASRYAPFATPEEIERGIFYRNFDHFKEGKSGMTQQPSNKTVLSGPVDMIKER